MKENGMEDAYTGDTDNEGNEINIGTDFSVNDEYKPNPLVPQGTYGANITKVSFDGDQQALVFTYCLTDNGGVMSDGETPIDGVNLMSRLWLPKPGDENEPTKDGRGNKRQVKINMMADFAKKTGLDMDTPHQIVDALKNQTWLGTRVQLKVTMREYQGKVFNDIKSVQAA